MASSFDTAPGTVSGSVPVAWGAKLSAERLRAAWTEYRDDEESSEMTGSGERRVDHPDTHVSAVVQRLIGDPTAVPTVEQVGAVFAGWVLDAQVATSVAPSVEWDLVDACLSVEISFDGIGSGMDWTFVWVHRPSGVAAMCWGGRLPGVLRDRSRPGEAFFRVVSPEEPYRHAVVPHAARSAYRQHSLSSMPGQSPVVAADHIGGLLDEATYTRPYWLVLSRAVGALSSPLLVGDRAWLLGQLAGGASRTMPCPGVLMDAVGLVPVRGEPWVPRLG